MTGLMSLEKYIKIRVVGGLKTFNFIFIFLFLVVQQIRIKTFVLIYFCFCSFIAFFKWNHIDKNKVDKIILFYLI